VVWGRREKFTLSRTCRFLFFNSILRHWAIKTTCRTERETKSSLEFFAPICTSRI
jgi:hypothetical protein